VSRALLASLAASSKIASWLPVQRVYPIISNVIFRLPGLNVAPAAGRDGISALPFFGINVVAVLVIGRFSF